MRNLKILFFFATWCKPCLKQMNDLDQLSNEFIVEYVNVYESKLGKDYGISVLPTTLVINVNEILFAFIGYTEANNIKKIIKGERI